jgi:primosomal protein N' (replication factor Y)
MLYAKVVLGIPVEGPFDYVVPENLYKKIKVGVRVKVSFHFKKTVAYVVKLSKESHIKNFKPVLQVIDDAPVLNRNMLLLTKRLSEYYCCSWGEAIETALPESLRKAKTIPNIEKRNILKTKGNSEIILVHSLQEKEKWDIYLKQIKEALDNKGPVIVLLPDINSLLKAKETISKSIGIIPESLYRKQPEELVRWLKVRRGEINIIVGTRSAIFAPLDSVRLIIIDEENDSAYKQEQVPHYHAREVAFMRARIEKAKVILGSASPSLESLYLTKKSKIKYIFIPREPPFPEIKIIDIKSEYNRLRQKRAILSKFLEDAISSVLNIGGKILLFLNRKGFATLASCQSCRQALRCPRCNINLVYHYKDNVLNCHYCNFKIEPPKICPNCHAGYIRYTGTGTEKIESELSRIFAQSKIVCLDKQKPVDIKGGDIFIATSSIIKETGVRFDLIGALAIDNSLNRIDLRAGEKTFALLVGLLGLTEKKIVIQTSIPTHSCFQALLKKDINLFYEEELRQRKQLNFSPYKHMALVKLRGQKEAKVKEASFRLFEGLNKANRDRGIKIISVNVAQPSKLRGNYHWQILITSDRAQRITKFLKIHLKRFSHSGIIVTVDVDPL